MDRVPQPSQRPYTAYRAQNNDKFHKKNYEARHEVSPCAPGRHCPLLRSDLVTVCPICCKKKKTPDDTNFAQIIVRIALHNNVQWAFCTAHIAETEALFCSESERLIHDTHNIHSALGY